MRCFVTLTVALTLTGMAACSTPPGGQPGGTPSTSASTPACRPTGLVELDALTFDLAPRQVIELSGGAYRLTATGFVHGGLLDPPVGRTTLAWGPIESMPTYAPGPANIPQRTGQTDLVEGEPTVVSLPAGRHWFLNSNGVKVRMEACSPSSATATPLR